MRHTCSVLYFSVLYIFGYLGCWSPCWNFALFFRHSLFLSLAILSSLSIFLEYLERSRGASEQHGAATAVTGAGGGGGTADDSSHLAGQGSGRQPPNYVAVLRVRADLLVTQPVHVKPTALLRPAAPAFTRSKTDPKP